MAMVERTLTIAAAVWLAACATPVGLEDGATALGGATAFPSAGGNQAASGGASSGSGGTGAKSSGGSGGLGGTGGFGTGGTSGGGTSGGGTSGGGTSSGGTSGGGTSGGGTGGSVSTGGTGGTCTPPVPGGLCDPVSQCGCASTQNCDVQGSTGFTSCGPAGPRSADQACATETDCSKGTSCVSAACKPFCNVDADCPNNGHCVQVYMGVPVPGWHACLAGCELQNPSARCGAGTTCLVVLPGMTDCVGNAGSGIGPASCSTGVPEACAPGYGCRPDGTCAQWCRAGMTDCPSGQSCDTTLLGETVDGVVYGTCA
jgi:hypothetical protein